ncbi:DUF928 domain-containing protein [Pannus brasiliensis CCIBt3594]|uniref:DUF928 domain-containing protein n=1 Tax=Pannus brasiliensis CCIBt3594 TaxID=1427578 RepID=A0AAW9QUK3_9CHRO
MNRKVVFSFSSLALALLIGLAGGTFTGAKTLPKYVPPPPRDERRQSTVSGGSRGCDGIRNVSVTPLVPIDHVPTTTLSHPTFLFHLDAIFPRPLIFTLVEPGVAEPIFQKKFTLARAGIVSLNLPANSKGLEEGKEYYWTIALSCNDKRPSANTYARAAIERVPVSSELKRELDAESDRLGKAEMYALAGIWYDALALSYRSDVPARERSGETDYFRQLLQQIGLNRILQDEDFANRH